MVKFRNYSPEPLFTEDYLKVREFLVRINRDKLVTPNFTWGRWEWMITHSMLNRSNLGAIALWENNGKIIGLATYETELGDAYFCVDEQYNDIKAEMLDYALGNLSKNGTLRAFINDNDTEFQRIAIRFGLRPTREKEGIAQIDINGDLSYTLPKGYRIISMADEWNWYQYNRCMWRGFNHEGRPPQTDEDIAVRKEMLSSPCVNPELVLAVVAPDGNYVSHCGMWYMDGDSYAYVEPVATDPEYRKMGLGKAVVLEAVSRCGKLGAKTAIVGSTQQFYYNIGFYPINTETWWTKQI